MIQYSKASQKSIQAAVAKAKSLKPKVKALPEFGKYQVCGSAGDCYTVTFKKVAGEFTSDCTCAGGKSGKICYHQVSASSQYKKAVADKAAATALAPVYTAEQAAADKRDLFG